MSKFRRHPQKMAAFHVKLSLKLFNSAMGIGGIATIFYGVLMLKVWQLQKEGSSSHHNITVPWFFHAFIGLGIALCAITSLGLIAANTTNITWLSTYIIILLLLLILETVIMADVFINPNWQKVLPVNLSDRFDDFMDFVGSYSYIWKWVAWSIFITQAICILLATLRIQVQNEVSTSDDESEDEEEPEPLLGRSARFPSSGQSSRLPFSGPWGRWQHTDPNIV